MNNRALNRKVYIICGSLLAILLVFVTVIAINKLNYEKTLLSDGIRAQARVNNKYHLKTRMGKIKKSYFELAIFEDTTAVKKQNKIKPQVKSKNINDKIDNLFKNFGTSKTPTTKYKSFTTTVSFEQYSAVKIGESVTFVYLKGELKKGILLDALE